MNALLNTTDPNNRLLEALGSAALFSDTTSTSSPLGLPLNVLDLGNVTDTTVDAAQPGAAGQTTSLPDITSLLGAANGDSPLTGGLPLDSLLGGNLLGELPVIGNGGTGDLLSGLDLDNLLGGIGGGVGGGAPGASTTPLDLAGEGTTLQPVFDTANALVKDLHFKLEVLSHQIGLPNAIHGVTNLGETIGLGEIGSPPGAGGNSNLITDTLNLPGDILSGNLNGAIANISQDLTDTIHSTSNLVKSLIFDGPYLNDATNPLPEILAGIGNTVQTLPLLSLGNGGLLGGLVGNLSGSSSGHLIDVDAGPQQSNGLVFDLLSAPGGDPGHTASVNAIDVGPNGPQLLDLSLLTGAGGLPLPGLGGGADGLTGNVLGDHGLLGGNLLGGITGGATGLASVTTIVADVTEILPIAGGLDHGPLNQVGTHLI